MTETSDTSSNPSSTGRQPAVGDPQETGGQPAVDNQGGQESNETPEANERQRSAVPNQEDIQDQEFQVLKNQGNVQSVRVKIDLSKKDSLHVYSHGVVNDR